MKKGGEALKASRGDRNQARREERERRRLWDQLKKGEKHSDLRIKNAVPIKALVGKYGLKSAEKEEIEASKLKLDPADVGKSSAVVQEVLRRHDIGNLDLQ